MISSIFRATSIIMSCTCHSFIGNNCLCWWSHCKCWFGNWSVGPRRLEKFTLSLHRHYHCAQVSKKLFCGSKSDKNKKWPSLTFRNACNVLLFYRVETVLGSDRVIVMSEGKAIEVGHPNLLLQNPDSEFSKHVNANNWYLFYENENEWLI